MNIHYSRKLAKGRGISWVNPYTISINKMSASELSGPYYNNLSDESSQTESPYASSTLMNK